MARVDYTGAPESEAPATPPNAYQDIQTSPNAFGASAAEGLKNLGQGGLEFEKFYGQVTANDGGNSYLDAATQVNAKLHSLVGKDAIDYSHAATQQLNDTYEHISDTMPTPQAKLQFAQDTRRLHSSILEGISDYGAAQTKEYAKNTNDQTITSGAGMAVMGDISGNQNSVDAARSLIRNAYVKNAQLTYGASDTQAANLAVQRADSYFYKSRIRAALPTNPALAQRLLTEGQGSLSTDPDFDMLNSAVKTGVRNATIGPAVDAEIATVNSDALNAVHGVAPASGAISEAQAANAIPYLFPGATITSGQRTPEHNAEVGGVPDSMHLSGQAVDFVPPKGTTKEQVAAALDKAGLPHTELIDEGTHIHWGWGNKDGAPQQASVPSQTYPSTIDYMRLNEDRIYSDQEKKAQQLFPNDPEGQDRYLEKFSRQYNLTVSHQEQQYEVSAHVVQTAMDGAYTNGRRPTSMEELHSISPQVSAAVDSLMMNKPLNYNAVQNVFDANSKGAAPTLGADFKSGVDRVLAPGDDPNRAKSASDLWPLIGSGKDAAITNSGANQLSSLLAVRGTPGGEAFIDQVRTLSDMEHGNLSFSSSVAGVRDPQGEARYSAFMAQAIPILTQAYKQGPQAVADILDPKSKDYLGNIAQHFARPPAERLRDLLSDEPRSGAERDTLKNVYGLPDNASKLKALQEAVSSQTISRADAERIGYTLGLIAPNGPPPPPVPKPE